MINSSARGRPLKFGRPARAVAVTLPDDVIASLRAVDADLGRAIVSLVEGRKAGAAPPADTVSLVRMGRKQALIVVNPAVLPTLPGCGLMRIGPNRAFITLDPGAGPADLELAVLDRLSDPGVGGVERDALRTLRRELRRWRKDSRVHAQPRAIVVLEGPSS